MAPVLPALDLDEEGLRHTLLLKPLHLVRDAEVGDSAFDERFLVRATEAAARTILTPEVRAGLLAVSRVDVPFLHIKKGQAQLDWRYSFDPQVLRTAIEVLLALRNLPLAIELLRNPAR